MEICKMRLLPTFSNVVIQMEVKKPGKLILADRVAESIFKRWKVAAVGPDCTTVKVDQYIVFNSPTAGEIVEGEKKYVILQEKDIVAVYAE